MNLNTKIKRIVESLKPYEPEKIYLFGSWARGEGDSLSDLDLVLIKKTRVSFF
ncbi:MAG: nucleotidyltransferase domain-containing protein [Syntrophaceae bacterium]